MDHEKFQARLGLVVIRYVFVTDFSGICAIGRPEQSFWGMHAENGGHGIQMREPIVFGTIKDLERR